MSRVRSKAQTEYSSDRGMLAQTAGFHGGQELQQHMCEPQFSS
jgi:hypothetical protein